MAKRARGAVRPGQRPPIQRRPTSAGTSSPVRPAAGLTDDEARRAEELEAAIRSEERASELARKRTAERAQEPRERDARGSSLAAIASHEYDYVIRDLRRIAVVAGSLLAILFVLYLVIEVAGVIQV